MSEARCPRCDERIRLPEPIPSADASGQCPWCQETFELHELLDRLPPMLRIVDTASDQATSGYGFSPDGGEDEPFDQQYMIRDEESAAPATAAPALQAAPRRQKKPSPLRSVLQIVAGGLVSIPLAFGILLLLKYLGLANPNLGFPPLDGTPMERPMSAAPPRPVAPAETPSPDEEPEGRMLGDEMPAFGDMDPGSELDQMLEDPDTAASPDLANEPAPSPPTEEPSEEIAADAPGEPRTEPEISVADTDSAPDAPTEEVVEVEAEDTEPTEDLLSMAPAEVDSPLGQGQPEPAGTAPPDGEEPSDSAAIDEPMERVAEQLNPELEAVVAAAKQASEALASHTDPATHSTALKDLYLELAKLAELAPPDRQDLYAELFAQLRQAGQLETMGQFGKPWFLAPRRLYEGVFATGTLVSEGDGYELQWNEGGSVPVAGWSDSPADAEALVGRKVAMLAKIDTAAEPRRLSVAHVEQLDPADGPIGSR